MSYIWPMVLLVVSNTVYQLCAKSVPKGINPFASLIVTYLIGAAASLVLELGSICARHCDRRAGSGLDLRI